DHPEMCGVNPEFAHETMAGLNFVHHVAQALEAGKLFHIDLNDQEMGRYDQDFRFGSVSYKANFFLAKLLIDYKYKGMKHFDSHAYRQADYKEVKAFAAGSMRTWKILEHKVAKFNKDRKIQSIIAKINRGEKAAAAKAVTKFSKANAKALLAADLDRVKLAKRPLPYETLDQLTLEIIMGVR
nr:hypothetical protein [Phycisphaeraceae bacterium]